MHMDMEMLQAEINESGLPMTKLAIRSKIPRATLYYRIEHPETWTVKEMIGICKALKLTNAKRKAIFKL